MKLLLVGATLAAAPAVAQDGAGSQTVQQGPIPAWASVSDPLPVPSDATGLGFVRAQDTIVHLDATGQQTFVSQRFKLLHPQALQVGNLAIAWNPAVGSPTFHTLRIVRGEQIIDLMERAKFDILRREDQLEEAMLSGILTAVLKVPDLRVGDEIEWAYTVPTGDPTLKDRNAGVLLLAGSTLPGRYRLGLNWEAGQQPQIKATDDFGAPLLRSGSGLEVLVDNPPTLTPPKDAPPRFLWQRAIEYSDFPSWSAMSSRFATLFSDARALETGSPLEAEAARIAAAETTPLGRAQAALALVQEQVRYVYVGLDGGNFRPVSADETWRRRFGDCKGKTALLLSLLDKLGIKAEPVLVSNGAADDGYDARMPNPGLFDHVLVRASIDGRPYWLDGTLPAVATANTSPDIPYSQVLPLTAAGSDLVRLPWKPAPRPDTLSLYEIDIRNGIDQPARIVSTQIRRGPKALTDYFQFSALTADQLLEGFRSNLTGSSTWDSVESVKYRYDKASRAGILEIVGTGPLDWDKDTGGVRSLSLPGGGFSPPGRRQRASDQNQDVPFYDQPEFNCHVTTVRLPADTKTENWSHNSWFDTMMFGSIYYRAFDRRDGTIRMIRGSRTERVEIDKVNAERDNGRLPRFDNSMAWIYYNPGEEMTSLGTTERVPATWERDWTTDADACLPRDMRG